MLKPQLDWRAGGVIYLNGVSSAGKSTIAQRLHMAIEQPCLNWGVDYYMAAFQPGILERDEFIKPYWPGVIRGFHQAAAGMARAGNVVIVDDVLEPVPPWWLYFRELFGDLWFLFVGVRCPLEILERRELARKDRKPDMPVLRWQYERVHNQATYDLELDTSTLGPQECTQTILDFIRRGEIPTAIERLA